MTFEIRQGDALDLLREMPEASVQTVVTSPPYWGLRDYGTAPVVWGGDPGHEHVWGALLPPKPGPGNKVVSPRSSLTNPGTHFETPRATNAGAFCGCGAWRGSLGLEPTPALYVEHMVQLFREVRRVLRPDGTLWLNLGDCYATGAGKVGEHPGGGEQGARWRGETTRHRDARRRPHGRPAESGHGVPQVGAENKTRATRDGSHAGKHTAMAAMGPMQQPNRMPLPGLKPKDLVGIPWRVAFALQEDGWWLRADIVWAKPNPMPESVEDRPTKAHEYLFLLTKSEHYSYDAAAIAEPITERCAERPELMQFRDDRPDVGGPFRSRGRRGAVRKNETRPARRVEGFQDRWDAKTPAPTRNRRSVWSIAPEPFPEAHFAVMPQALVEPCVLAGSGGGGDCA